MVKKLFLAIILWTAVLLPLHASSSWDDFSANVSEQNVRAFAKDLGGLIGSGTYTTGRVLGWGGFQIGPRGTMLFKMRKK